jgi:glutamyl-tRNA synthetase
VSFDDALLGPQTFDPQAEVGDFVLQRADGVFAYQLAVVVDDAAMGMSQVLRGADLLPSTARQLVLYRLLGARPPRFAHAPLVFGGPGPDSLPARLSKRDRAVSLTALRQDGHSPRALVGRLAQSLGLLPPGVLECRPAELVPGFALDRVPRTPIALF